ncbi:MAG: acyl-CoA thioesterase [Gammaproteobacteria bacterium]|jgi:acyl-CoA thioesterase
MFTSLMSVQRIDETRFTAPQPCESRQRIFGGQFLAQALRAAIATVDEERDVNSLHAYFVRPGDTSLPVDLSVESVRDGRSFSSRQMIAQQRDKELFRMQVSFQAFEDSPQYTRGAMPQVPPPEQVTLTYDDFNVQQSGPQDADFRGASLDHAMWFHRPARVDQWLLFEQTVEATGSGRGLVNGRFFDRQGCLVANCIQQGLMRWARP